MGQRIVTLILVVALGVFVGVGLVAKQVKDPVLKSILSQQEKILDGQKRLEQALAQSPQRGGEIKRTGGQSDRDRIRQLEQRVANLEIQTRSLQAVVQQLQARPNQQRPAPQNQPKMDTTKYDIPIDHSYVKGDPQAKVTIVEFLDFQCPFCARFHKPMEKAVKAYGKDVKVVLKNFPLSFHKNAKPAAKAAFAAGEQGKYWEMVNALLANGKNLTEDKFEELAKDLGLNVKKFWKDYRKKDAQWEAYIQKDIELGQKVGVRGTPTFYLNGRKTMARSVVIWKREIDKVLKEADSDKNTKKKADKK